MVMDIGSLSLSLSPQKNTVEGSHLQAWKRALTRNQTDQYLDFGLSVLRNVRGTMMSFRPPKLIWQMQ
jgi:hypothetical protein